MGAIEEVRGPTPDGAEFTAESFLDYIRLSNPIWWNGHEGRDDCPWVFRGHSNADWALVPSAARLDDTNPLWHKINRDSNKIIISRSSSHISSYSSEQIEKLDLFSKIFFLHKLNIRKFFDLSKELRILNSQKEFVIEHKNMNAIDISSYAIWDYSTFDPHSTSEKSLKTWVHQLAQHHRIPTFLLDWTKKPEIAAYFAVAELDKCNTEIAIFCINKKKFDFFVEADPALSDFIYNQHGIFSYNYDSSFIDFIAMNGRYKSIEEIIEEKQSEGLKKIILNKNAAVELKELLRRERYSKAHLMPTLDNVGEAVLR